MLERKTYTIDIVTRPGETADEAIDRVLPEHSEARIVGGFPVGSHWDRTRGLVVEYTELTAVAPVSYECPSCGNDCSGECSQAGKKIAQSW